MKKLFFFALIIKLSALTYAQECASSMMGEFVPVEQSKEDSIYYFVTLSQFTELHTNKGFRNIYDLKWFSGCSFELTPKEIQDSFSQKNILGRYSLQIVNDTIVQLSGAENILKFKRKNGFDFWQLALERDKELQDLEQKLRKRTEELRETFGEVDTIEISKIMEAGLQIVKGTQASKTDVETIFKFFKTLANYDAEKFYSNTTEDYKQRVDRTSLEQYFSYLDLVYGKWEYFSIFKQPVEANLFGQRNEERQLFEYIFKVKFEKCSEETSIHLTLKKAGEENRYFEKFGSKTDIVCVNMDLGNIGDAFFDSFYGKKYGDVYDRLHPIMKQEATEAQVENLLKTIEEERNGNQFQFYHHSFTHDDKVGGILNLYYKAKSDERTVYLTLVFSEHSGVKKLAGVHMDRY